MIKYPPGAIQSSDQWHLAKYVVVVPRRFPGEAEIIELGEEDRRRMWGQWNLDGKVGYCPKDYLFENYWLAYILKLRARHSAKVRAT